MSPYFILSGGNQPSSNLVLLDHRRRTRDYVMFVWTVMRKNPHIVRGLKRIGFTGGWLDQAPVR